MISAMQVCAPSQIHTILTDDSADPELITLFRQRNVVVTTV
jgi:DeoR/GlpR family transcriptional regulator of sugar metabolism